MSSIHNTRSNSATGAVVYILTSFSETWNNDSPNPNSIALDADQPLKRILLFSCKGYSYLDTSSCSTFGIHNSVDIKVMLLRAATRHLLSTVWVHGPGFLFLNRTIGNRHSLLWKSMLDWLNHICTVF